MLPIMWLRRWQGAAVEQRFLREKLSGSRAVGSLSRWDSNLGKKNISERTGKIKVISEGAGDNCRNSLENRGISAHGCASVQLISIYVTFPKGYFS